MAKVKIKSVVEEILNPFLQKNGLELYNIEYIKEAKDWFLRVYIDKPENSEEKYISTDDCELVSRYLSEKLDESDPIEQNYYLEVSSPGMDRTLFQEKDYIRYTGSQVEVNLYQALDGKKRIEGKLEGISDGKLILKDEKGNSIEISMDKVAKTKLAIVF